MRQEAASLSTLELLYEVSRELATALNLQSVLERILLLSLKHVGAGSGAIIVLDEQGEPFNSAIIYKETIFQQTTERLRSTLESGLAGWVVRNRESALVIDTNKDERWERRQYEDGNSTGPKSSVSVPLIVRDDLIGVMTLSHPQTGFFTEEHLALVQAIASQAAIAALSARLFDQTQHRAAVMTALAESASAINASLEADEVFQQILTQTLRALGAKSASLALLNENADQLVFRACVGLGREADIGMSVPVAEGIMGWAVKNEKSALVPDVMQDDRYLPGTNEVKGKKTKSVAVAPIRVGSRVIGVIEAGNPHIDSTTITVLEGIGNLAGSAIRHADVFNEARIARRRYRELFKDSVAPILITTWTGRILEGNRRAHEFTGLDAGELAQKQMGDIQKIDWGILGQSFSGLKEQEIITYQSELLSRATDSLPIEVNVRQIFVDGEDRLQWQFRDLTEQIEIDKMREDLLSMVYHDLRSPLANVTSSLDMLAVMLPLEEDAGLRSVLDIAVRSTDRVQRLTSSLLDIARLEAGQQITQLEEISLRDLLKDTAGAVVPLIEAKKQIFTLTVPKGKTQLKIDTDMIRRVLINLLENAMKYGPEGTTIKLGATIKNKNLIELWVADDGKGISKEDQSRIFVKYERIKEKKSKAQGLGLGLAFCKLAVEAHGGEIWVESEIGKGSRFIFRLPI